MINRSIEFASELIQMIAAKMIKEDVSIRDLFQGKIYDVASEYY